MQDNELLQPQLVHFIFMKGMAEAIRMAGMRASSIHQVKRGAHSSLHLLRLNDIHIAWGTCRGINLIQGLLYASLIECEAI